MTDIPAPKRYIDLDSVGETFADGVRMLYFDGKTFRLEFSVSRLDEVKPAAPLTMREHPACRLVLTPDAAIDLLNKLNQLASALEQQGVLKKTVSGPSAPTVAH